MKTNIHLSSYLAQFLEWKTFQTKIVKKIKTHISCSITLLFIYLENSAVYEIMWKNTVEPGRPDYDMVLAHCSLDT
jgi:hypothetical protein